MSIADAAGVGRFALSIAAASGGKTAGRRAGVPLEVLLLEGETRGGRFALSIYSIGRRDVARAGDLV